MQRRRAALAGNDRAEYKRVNRLCRAAVRNESRARFESAIGRGDRGGLWRVPRPIIGRKQQQCEIPLITPDALNNYYVIVGPSTAASVPVATDSVPTRLTRVSTCAFEVRQININMLYATLPSMKPSNATGVDGISVCMLQKFFVSVGLRASRRCEREPGYRSRAERMETRAGDSNSKGKNLCWTFRYATDVDSALRNSI